nr:RNA-dependent RNA polymerase [Sarcosphaera coronaria partitivirus]
MQNITHIGTFPKKAFPIVEDFTHPETIANYNRIVDHALKQFLSEDEFTEVTTGYRRSEWSPLALQHDIETLNAPEHVVPKDKHYEIAFNAVKEMFTPEVPLRPIHFADLRHYPLVLSTNAGAPFASSKKWQDYVKAKWNHFKNGIPFKDLTHRDLFAEAHQGQSLNPTMVDARMTKRNLYNEMFFLNRTIIHKIKDGIHYDNKGRDFRYWHTAFARQHIVKAEDPDKVRLVFGAPSTGLFAELMFVWPIQTWLLSLGEKSPMLWGFETITGGWYRLRNYFSRTSPRHELVGTLDFSKFDKYARHDVIKDIHRRIMRPMFTFDEGYHPTYDYPISKEEGYDPQRIENLWNWMTDEIRTTPLMLPNGDLLRFNHAGIFSGYFQTQLLDSIYNLIMIFTILSACGFSPKKVTIKVQGDDSIFMLLCCFILVSHWLMSMMVHYAKYYFGAIISDKKSEIRSSLEHAEVLKYRNSNGLPYRDSIALLAQLRHPERGYSYEQLLARSIGIAYANCGHDPRVFQICEDIHRFLKTAYPDLKPNRSGLPGSIRYMSEYIDHKITIDEFPTMLDTCIHLLDKRDPQPSERYWPRSHFIGIPGRSD